MQRYLKTKNNPRTISLLIPTEDQNVYETVETIQFHSEDGIVDESQLEEVNEIQYEEVYADQFGKTEQDDDHSSSEPHLIEEIEAARAKFHYCSNCGNSYNAAGSLKLHQRACLKRKEQEASNFEDRKCKLCGKIYYSASYLKEHMLRHTMKPKKCDKCSRKFFDQEKLEQHIKTHDTVTLLDPNDDSPDKKIIKEFTCSFCHEKFIVAFESKAEVKRRFACDDCLVKFKDTENLRKHKESMEEKKTFKCERCGRLFVFEGFLQRHEVNCDGIARRRKN